ncbi:MAG: hypothetical protein M4579_007042 [Chaenotheca gracillima]|nr:MAG: hypothetical protein M4579_007042 [Chaenotheca gracillima]
MDIHRCRFVPYPLSTINALAFSHPSSADRKSKVPSSLRLAIGRANGDIEIWNPQHGTWVQETTFRGGKDRSIEGLVWTQEPDDLDEHGKISSPGRLRLFSIGYSSFVTEWDLERGLPLRHSGDSFGEIWCLAAQPRTPTKAGNTEETQDLVVGCADGAVVLLSTADSDLRFKRSVSRSSKKKARVLSVAFQSRFVAVAGCADGTIRVLDTRNGNSIRTMSSGVGPSGGPRDILVWAVKSLPDGTLVSGDSTGEIRIWDGKTYTLVQRIKSHRADVLDVECSADGETLMSGGMDRRTVMYRKTTRSGGSRWAAISHQRHHTHDVKVLAKYEAGNMSVLASGGPDTSLVVVPIQKHHTENSRKISTLPQDPQVQSAPRRRLLMSWWDREVWIWRVNASAIHDQGAVPKDRSKTLLARIGIQGEENIKSASLSADGELLAIATASHIKLFALRESTSGEKTVIRVRKLPSPEKWEAQGARLVTFSPNSKWLCVVTPDNQVVMARIDKTEGSPEKTKILPSTIHLKRRHRAGQKESGLGALGRYDRSIIRAAFSADSSIFVVGDLSGYLDSWVLEGYEDMSPELNGETHAEQEDRSSSESSDDSGDDSDASNPSPKKHNIVMGQRWILNPSSSLLPKLPSAPSIMSFRPTSTIPNETSTNGAIALHPTRHDPHPHSHDLPTGEDRLFIVTTAHQLYEFHILKGRLTPWSRRNPTATSPNEFRILRDRAMGSVWDIGSADKETRERIWLYGNTWVCMFDLSQDFRPHVGHNDAEASEKEDDAHAAEVETNNKSKVETALALPLDKSSDRNVRRRNRRKRKRTSTDADEILHEHTSGAGSHIPETELVNGIGRKIRKTAGTGTEKEEEEISIAPTHGDDAEEQEDDEDDYDDEDGASTALTRVRRGTELENGVDGEMVNGNGTGSAELHRSSSSVALAKDAGAAFYCTYKYRPILGLVSLVPASASDTALEGGVDGEGSGGVEVALVERPTWDADLPPRSFGDQEWVR